LALVPIPFVFYRYGHKIRMKSGLIRSMQADKDRADAKKKNAEDKRNRLAARKELKDMQAVGEAGEAEKVAPVVGADALNMQKEKDIMV